jgi:hypothetical protein
MDSGFAKWKSNLTSVSLMPEILTNNMQDNRANALSAL